VIPHSRFDEGPAIKCIVPGLVRKSHIILSAKNNFTIEACSESDREKMDRKREMMKTREIFFEDYSIGEQKSSSGRTITEADIVLHAGQTGDFYPHHMDEVWCRTQPFGRRIAHGTLILSIAIGMTAGDINPRAMSYGYDRVRFIRPVFLGDTIHVAATIRGKREDPKRPNHGIVMEIVEVRNQEYQLVLVCEHLYLVEKRTGGF
jgi:acyl dehydratase